MGDGGLGSPVSVRLACAVGACSWGLNVLACSSSGGSGNGGTAADGSTVTDGRSATDSTAAADAETGSDSNSADAEPSGDGATLDERSPEGTTIDSGTDAASLVDGAGADADSAASGDAGYSCPDAAVDASSDPVAGVWIGIQVNETWTMVIRGGKGTATAVNDSCNGTYTVTGSSNASATLMCMPLTSAGIAGHTDGGTFTMSGSPLTYD